MATIEDVEMDEGSGSTETSTKQTLPDSELQSSVDKPKENANNGVEEAAVDSPVHSTTTT